MIAPYNAKVPADVVGRGRRRSRPATSTARFNIFTGPINDQDGTVQGRRTASVMTDGDLCGMDWFVEGVERRVS